MTKMNALTENDAVKRKRIEVKFTRADRENINMQKIKHYK